jgi:SulP family sulfate permease
LPLALVTEAIAFALLAGVDLLVGLYAAFTIGLVTSIIDGRPGMIFGATGAIVVVIVTLVAQHGVEYLFAAIIMTGLIQNWRRLDYWDATHYYACHYCWHHGHHLFLT